MKPLKLLFPLLFACACANPVETPADKPDASVSKDGGVLDASVMPTHVLETSNLAPAAQTAETGDYRIRGHLRSSDVRESQNATKRIRGGLVPLTR